MARILDDKELSTINVKNLQALLKAARRRAGDQETVDYVERIKAELKRKQQVPA